MRERKDLVKFDCEDCGAECKRPRSRMSKYALKCRRCSLKSSAVPAAIEASKRIDRTGKNNPNWKGGHKYWQAGKNGRDKNGLSKTIQFRLALERDNYTCQHCDRKEDGWKPEK